MNMQAMLKQAQRLQSDMLKVKKEIDEKIFVGKSSIVEVEVFGTKKIKSLKINQDCINNDEMELLEDMIMVAMNDAFAQIDKEIESKIGKYTQGMPGIF